MFLYCNNNPIMYSDSCGYAPELWQWATSGAMFVTGVVLVATGVGGAAGGALICAGVNSIIGSYTSEAAGGSSVAGWVGGTVSGAFCGAGAGMAGSFMTQAVNSVGVSAITYLSASTVTAFGTGAAGSAIGQSVTAAIDGKPIDGQALLSSSLASGAINCMSGIGAGVGNALQGMHSISTTSIVVSNSLNLICSVATEGICDLIATIPSLLN